MNKTTVDELIALLAALFKHSREHAARFRVLEQIAQEHPEIFAEYQDRVSEIERNAVFQKSHDHTLEAIDRLRTGLLQE
jgi:hypothetical protein